MTTAQAPAADDSPVVAPEPAVVASSLTFVMKDGVVRETFDGCLRCFGAVHTGDCPPAL